MAYFDKGRIVYGTNGTPAVKPSDRVNEALSQQPKVQGPQMFDQFKQSGVTPDTSMYTSGVSKTLSDMYNQPTQINGADRVKEALSATSGNTAPTVTQQTNPQTNPQNEYNQRNQQAVDAYKSGQTGMSVDEYTKIETDRRAAEAEAIRARVRAAIQQGVDAQNKIINDAPTQFVDPMNRASFQGAKNSQAIDERMAAMGLGRSGANITSQVSNSNQTAANINDLENAKQKVISDAKQAIASLQAQGSLEEVRQVQEAAAKSLERLQNQINVIDDRANRANETIFNNATLTNKSLYDIGSNERQLSMQERTTDSNITGIDPKTGLPTLATKQFNAQEAQRIWENNFKQGAFDYQKTRDGVSDQQWGKQYQLQLDQFAWNKSPDNPSVKAQIINNQINDLNLQRMQDPNSPENQLRYTQAKSAMDNLNKQIAITPEMTVKQYNAQLDKIYADISQGWKQLDISQQGVNNAAANTQLAREQRQDTLTEKKDQSDYQDAYEAIVKQYATANYDPETEGKVIGYSIGEDKKGRIREQLKSMAEAGISKNVINKLANNLGIQ